MSIVLRSTLSATTAAAFAVATLFVPAVHAQNAASHKASRAARMQAPPTGAAAPAHQLPPRIPFTAADDAAAAIPGMPDARFFADSVADFQKALPAQAGPWLALSTGGSDRAFGAGFLNGLCAPRQG